MSKKVIPLSVDALQTLTETYPTPFHLYDERGIRENARLLQKAFSWNPGFKEYFAVKATPNPYICLLYTSPSPRDRQKSRMPSSA